MSQLRVVFSVLGVALLLGGCGQYQSYREVETLKEASAVGSPFTQRLTEEYRTYASVEQDQEHDNEDAIHFGRKGTEAAEGEVVMPESLDDWDLSEAHLVEMGEGRSYLVTALELGGREIAPDIAAVAQARFDCWVEEQEEDWDAVPPCRNEFAQALAQLNDAVGSVVQPEVVEPAPMAAPADPVEPEVLPLEQALFIVFFDWDKSTLTDGANEVLNAVANEVLTRNDVSAVVVTGHADRSGPDGYNQKLSQRRAVAVEKALAQRGVPAGLVRVQSRGETQPLVDTADNVREPANRRAEIGLE